MPEPKDFLPTPPSEGPPLPRGLGLKWPWMREKIYKVDDIKVSIKYERPGVHLITLATPGGRGITEEEGERITKLLEEKTK